MVQKLEDKVLTLEQMQHLKQLGFEPKETALCWCYFHYKDNSESWELGRGDNKGEFDPLFVSEYVPTLTFSEIFGKILPEEIEGSHLIAKREYGSFFVSYLQEADLDLCDGDILVEFSGKTAIESAYKMLCWVLEKDIKNSKK